MPAHLKQRLARAVKWSTTLTCAAMIVDNLGTMALPRRVRGYDEIADPAGHARRAAGVYAAHAAIRGRVAEIGPGGTDAVARRLLALGCDSVDQIDRFGRGGSSQDARVRAYAGKEADAERFFRDHKGYDAIVSSAVLEHVRDPLGALAAMAGALRPGGTMVHEIDLRDHGMFRDPSAFLRVPEWLWGAMTSHCGRPNRVLLHRYREALDGLGLEYEILVTDLRGVGPVPALPFASIPEAQRKAACGGIGRSRLAKPLRGVAAEDLAVSGFLLVARKPPCRSAAGRPAHAASIRAGAAENA
jgi:SAM-dependent methyltransferase